MVGVAGLAGPSCPVAGPRRMKLLAEEVATAQRRVEDGVARGADAGHCLGNRWSLKTRNPASASNQWIFSPLKQGSVDLLSIYSVFEDLPG